MNKRLKETYPENVDGDFYVEKDCCTMCGLPGVIAPELFKDKGDEYCYIKKQPCTKEETEKMIEIVNDAEFDCIRYCGYNKKILSELEHKDRIYDHHKKDNL